MEGKGVVWRGGGGMEGRGDGVKWEGDGVERMVWKGRRYS